MPSLFRIWFCKGLVTFFQTWAPQLALKEREFAPDDFSAKTFFLKNPIRAYYAPLLASIDLTDPTAVQAAAEEIADTLCQHITDLILRQVWHIRPDQLPLVANQGYAVCPELECTEYAPRVRLPDPGSAPTTEDIEKMRHVIRMYELWSETHSDE